MEGTSGVTRSIIDEIHCSDIQRVEMKSESGVTRSITDKLHSSDIQRDEMEGERIVLLEVSGMNFILRISKDIK